ncbi:hypothetical protein, partial [Heyndrickxia coagulans]|uniref:hypothetical protein n=1 Tax=Heyndrickxia coagulans TaxID=1398 RepID=UPI0028524920
APSLPLAIQPTLKVAADSLLVGSIHFDPSLLNSSKYLSYFNCIKAIREKMLKIVFAAMPNVAIARGFDIYF